MYNVYILIYFFYWKFSVIFHNMTFFSQFANVYMAMKDCLVPNRQNEVQEEILADLHNCVDQLNERVIDMELRLQTAAKQMVIHAKNSQAIKGSEAERFREKKMAQHFFQEKKRIQNEIDKTNKNISLIQQQIDCIVSSQLNMVIVDTMKQFNANTSKMNLAFKTSEMENLEEQLQDRSREIVDLQEAINNVSSSIAVNTNNSMHEDEQELWKEIEYYLEEPDHSSNTIHNSIASKEIASKEIASKEIASKEIASKEIASKDIDSKDIESKTNESQISEVNIIQPATA